MKLEQAKTRITPNELIKHDGGAKRLSVLSTPNRSEIVYLRAEQLKPYHKQARRIFDEESINMLAESIREYGIRQPLTVLRTDDEIPMFEVVSGERRLKAAILANLKQIPCIILQDASQAEEIALVENIQRQDLHPVELARSLKDLTEARGWGGQKEIREKIGLSASQISELLKINELSEEVQQAMLEHNFRGREKYRKLFTLSDEQKQIALIRDEAAKPTKTQETSVLRVLWLEDSQMPRLQMKKKLSLHQKTQMLVMLKNVIAELESEL